MDLQSEINDIRRAAYGNLIVVLSAALTYGIYLPISLLSIMHLWNRHRRVPATPTKWLIGLLVFLFITTTAYFAMEVAAPFVLFLVAPDPLTNNPPSWQQQAQSNDVAHEVFSSGMMFFQACNFVAGDSIVVWRALALWPGTKIVQFSLWFLLFVSGVMAITDASNITVINVRGTSAAIDSNQQLDSASMLLSLCVNIVATGLIIYKAWELQKTMPTRAQGATRKPVTYRILIGLIECGLAFCIVQATNAGANLSQTDDDDDLSHHNLFVLVINIITPIIAGAYPSVVLLLARHKSALDGTDVIDGTHVDSSTDVEDGSGATRGKARPVSDLRFVARPGVTSTFSSNITSTKTEGKIDEEEEVELGVKRSD